MAEGAKVLGEALASGSRVESVYVDPGHAGPEIAALVGRCLDAGSRVFELDDGVLERVAGTVSPQPVLAIVGDVDITLEDLHARHADLVVVCADVRDPGNAGTVLRSAEAAGAGGVIVCEGSVDVYNPKTVRASAGAVFHIPVVVGGQVASILEALSGWGLHRVGAAARRGVDYTEMDLRRPFAMVIGNEATGLSAAAEGGIDEWLNIPMVGRSESLNVGITAAVVCFEAARQRRSIGVGDRP
ncbi:MAG: RNA methyltransferase [Actinomycetota bacterium]|nr:RNA methyltransferase [Actinomycetota bacterium]